MAGTIELPRGCATDLSVRRGRDAGSRLADMVRDARARGDDPQEVRVSPAVADDMRAFFAWACASFDGVLPRSVLGVPFRVGDTGGSDYVMKTMRRGVRAVR